MIACAHFNDLEDSLGVYGSAELGRWIEVDEQGASRLVSRPLVPRRAVEEWWGDHLAPLLRAKGAFRWARESFLGSSSKEILELANPEHGRRNPSRFFCPSQAHIESPFEPWAEEADEGDQLAWRAQVVALSRTRDAALERGARLLLFDLGYPRAFSRAIADLALRLGVEYSPAGGDVLDAALRGEEVYLKDDGHWTPLGCRRIAESLARDLRPLVRTDPQESSSLSR